MPPLTTLLPLAELANRPRAMEPNRAGSSGLWMMSFMVAIKCPPTKYRMNEKGGCFRPAVLAIRTGHRKRRHLSNEYD